ncbi:MAG: MBL fold metallo-hydrolase [Chloroflexota bacterium]
MLPTRPILQDLRGHTTGTALWWLGNAGWAIKSDDVLLLVDPVIARHPSGDSSLAEIGLPLVHALPLRADELGPDDPDLVLVTHAHGDHLAPRTIPILSERTRCRFVVPTSCAARMRDLGIPDERTIPARHGQPISHKRLTITPMKALHGHTHGAVYAGANFGDCGYLIHDGRWTILHPGDSVLLQEHLDMAPPDVFLASITEHNLWQRNTALLANLWSPRYIVPMHYDTYAKEIFWTVGDPSAVRALLDESVRPHYVVLPQGRGLRLGEQ